MSKMEAGEWEGNMRMTGHIIRGEVCLWRWSSAQHLHPVRQLNMSGSSLPTRQFWMHEA